MTEKREFHVRGCGCFECLPGVRFSPQANQQWEAAKDVARRHREQASELNRRAQKRASGAAVPLPSDAKRLLSMVCESYGMTMGELLGRRKTKGAIEARQLVMYLARRLSNLSYPEVGELLDRIHTTVMSGEKQAAYRMVREPRYLARAEEIERRWAQPVAAE